MRGRKIERTNGKREIKEANQRIRRRSSFFPESWTKGRRAAAADDGPVILKVWPGRRPFGNNTLIFLLSIRSSSSIISISIRSSRRIISISSSRSIINIMGRFWRTAPGGGREALVLKDTVSGLYGRCTLCVVDTEDRIMMGAVKRRGCAGRTVMERRVSRR